MTVRAPVDTPCVPGDARTMTKPTTNPLREARRAKGWTQTDLAARVGLSRGWVQLTESYPMLASEATLAKIAGALGIPVSTIIARRHIPEIW